jgi:hypothetical protein
MKSVLQAGAVALAVSAMVACGMPGVPQPPSLELPRTAQDLRAVRKGDRVFLAWTTPGQATDHSTIRHLGVTRICRAANDVAVVECRGTAGTLEASQTRPSAPASFTDTLPAQLLEQRGFVSYAVEVQNRYGRSAGLSNQVIVPLAAVARPAVEVHAVVIADGVRLEWRGDPSGNAPEPGSASGYEVYRQPADAPEQAPRTDLGPGEPQPSATGGLAPFNFLDRTAEWERPYRYTVAPLTRWSAAGRTGSFEGDEVTIQVTPHDIFPPAPPSGLQAVGMLESAPPRLQVDLSWTPNRESDLAGYNVYRRGENTSQAKINPELVNAPVFRDSGVQAGQRYWYAITAVDVRGNESGKSSEASEVLPK